MPFNLLLLPLLGGYFFIHLTYRFRFRAYGLDNYRLVFESAAVGLVALLVSHILTRIALQADEPESLRGLDHSLAQPETLHAFHHDPSYHERVS